MKILLTKLPSLGSHYSNRNTIQITPCHPLGTFAHSLFFLEFDLPRIPLLGRSPAAHLSFDLTAQSQVSVRYWYCINVAKAIHFIGGHI
ncbi:unnamed protein product [Ilex paraguariensis]|uniref:Uncharacterized protein n=1 Tax=Ilex paraguariensis TaxID=185542 RepID=A0ABC8QVL2_9AQUA